MEINEIAEFFLDKENTIEKFYEKYPNTEKEPVYTNGIPVVLHLTVEYVLEHLRKENNNGQ